MSTERPVRILHVITRLILGGAQENTLLTVIGQQSEPRYRVTLLSGIDEGPEGNLHERARAAGVDLILEPTLVRPIQPLTDLRCLVRLWRFMRRGRYDIVHTHSSKAGILGRVAARLAGVPIVVHTLHSLVFHEYQQAWKNRLYIALKRLCAPLTDALISVNDKTTEGALAAGIGRPEQYLTIFSGMELEPFLAVRDALPVAEAKRRLGIPQDAPVVGKIARLFPLKGHEQFFEAAERIAAAEPRAFFLLVGNGTLREELEQRAQRLGIAPRTVFAGLVPPEQVPACIQAMDVVVHASLREGIARVIPQAGAVGKPVVAFAMDGAPEVIRDGVSGCLVPPRDAAALAERTLALLGDPARRRAMGEAGREFAAEHFRVETMVERIDAVYEKLLVSRRRA
ncbi:MAG TPA: glycosyltransferase family 4 protein [Vicinamibacteria bacterium]|nr:glycosyltransferase family 4 protein [Vicinamibacteria bacterium]